MSKAEKIKAIRELLAEPDKQDEQDEHPFLRLWRKHLGPTRRAFLTASPIDKGIMGLCNDMVKEVADYVTLDVDDSGLAAAVKKFLL